MDREDKICYALTLALVAFVVLIITAPSKDCRLSRGAVELFEKSLVGRKHADIIARITKQLDYHKMLEEIRCEGKF